MSLQDFSKVISASQPELDFDFHRDIFPQIQKLIADTYKAAYHKIDPNRLQSCFEVSKNDSLESNALTMVCAGSCSAMIL